jgi:hypothetical protein
MGRKLAQNQYKKRYSKIKSYYKILTLSFAQITAHTVNNKQNNQPLQNHLKLILRYVKEEIK